MIEKIILGTILLFFIVVAAIIIFIVCKGTQIVVDDCKEKKK